MANSPKIAFRMGAMVWVFVLSAVVGADEENPKNWREFLGKDSLVIQEKSCDKLASRGDGYEVILDWGVFLRRYVDSLKGYDEVLEKTFVPLTLKYMVILAEDSTFGNVLKKYRTPFRHDNFTGLEYGRVYWIKVCADDTTVAQRPLVKRLYVESEEELLSALRKKFKAPAPSTNLKTIFWLIVVEVAVAFLLIIIVLILLIKKFSGKKLTT